MPARYTRVAIILHWLIAFMIIGLIAFGLLMTNEGVPNRFALYQWHKTFGITVLVLSLLRLIWRLTHRPPSLPDSLPSWQRRASHATHWAFYGLMIAMPLLGWAMVSASTLPVPTMLYGLIPLPDLPTISESEALYQRIRLLHEIGAKLFIALLLLHIGAALKHHVHDRDTVLRRMAPWLKIRK